MRLRPGLGHMLLNITTVIYAASIVLALLNYGAADLLIVTLFIFPIFAILLVLLVTREIPSHLVPTVCVALTILLGSAAWIAFQTIPLPGGLYAHPAWKEAEALVPEVRGTISVTPADDRAGYLRIAAPFGVFLCGLYLFSTDERARRALTFIAVAGGVMSFGSILQFVFAPSTLLFAKKIAYLDSLTGVFVNRNTAATFFGLLLLVEVAQARRATQAIEFRRIAKRFEEGRRLSPELRSQVAIAGLYLCLTLSCVVALLLTKSRAGIGASFIAVILLIVLASWGPRMRLPGRSQSRGPSAGRGASLIGGLIIILVFLAFGGRVLWRAQVQGGDDGRFCIIPGIWALVRDNFPLGSGLSSFIEVFPAYRDYRCGITGVWDMAHNFYLEGLVTLGIAFVVLALLAVTSLVLIFVTGLRTRLSFRFGPEIGMATLVLIAIHSAFDFSLQISGLAIFYAALLAPLTTLSLNEPGRRMERRRSSVSPRFAPSE
ncbi:O-antigen ligase like membrane protein [Rhizobium sp. NFR07]|nr:O-antigen ligase like membrane protein [Rhizobium sp. NFR07]